MSLDPEKAPIVTSRTVIPAEPVQRARSSFLIDTMKDVASLIQKMDN